VSPVVRSTPVLALHPGQDSSRPSLASGWAPGPVRALALTAWVQRRHDVQIQPPGGGSSYRLVPMNQPLPAAGDVHPVGVLSVRVDGVGAPVHRGHAPARCGAHHW
jgi:hypothetical protein